MKSSYKLFVLLFAIFIQNGKFWNVLGNPTIDDEILHEKDDEIKSFRKNYALRMKSFMNTSVDPCDDFYAFACGNYPNAMEQIETTEQRSTYYDIVYTFNDYIEVILQKQRHSDEKYSKELLKAKHLYDSCMDANPWPIEQKKEFLEVLKAIGGFPAIDPSWNASAFDWFKMTAHLSRYGVNELVVEKIGHEFPFAPYYELPTFGFNFAAHLENNATKEDPRYLDNVKVMKELLNTYGVSDSKADKVIEDVIEFWREALLADKMQSDEGYCDGSSDNYYDSTEFPKWNTFFDIAWEGRKFVPSETSDCPCNWYYNKLDAIIANRPEAAANYMALMFLYKMHPEPQVKSAKFQRNHCLSFVREKIPMVVSYFYIKEHYNKSAEAEINNIFSDIKLSLQNRLNTTSWLDSRSRTKALQKINSIRMSVGENVHPNTEDYINEINKLNLTDNFADNILEIAKFNVDLRHYSYLHSDINESILPIEMFPLFDIGAEYDRSEKKINILAGALYPPVYHPYFPKSLNYGGLGYYIGHEITHGFDSVDSFFDYHFKATRSRKKSIKSFKKRVNCFIQHYSQYTVSEINWKLDGTDSQNENIADSEGLRQALAAYRRVFKAAVENKVQDFERNESLPVLEMTPEQTFFLSFAQTFCAKYDLNDYWDEISNGYVPDKYRVLGSLRNNDAFPLVFNCPVDSRMNPKEKCRLF